MLTGAVLNDCADAVANDLRLARSGGAGAEAQFSQPVDSLGESEFVRFLSAEEHVLTIMPECGFSCRSMRALRAPGRVYIARAESGLHWRAARFGPYIRMRDGWSRMPRIFGICNCRRRIGRIDRAAIDARSIAALGITNQRETTIVWDRKSGRPVAPAIVWQCRRTAEACAALAESTLGSAITRKTGLVMDAYFSASKIQWILEHVPDARRKARDGELLFGTVDTWLIWKLTNGAVHVTDHSNASRTMLMDLETGEWDAGLLDVFGVPRGDAAADCGVERGGGGNGRRTLWG